MSEEDLLIDVLQGNESAIHLCKLLGHVSQVWDDLIDKDKPVSDEQINSAFIAALFRIQENQFYAEHYAQLHPFIHMTVVDWLTANTLEASGDMQDKHIAFIVRSTFTSVIIRCAYIIGGHNYVVEVAPRIRRHFHGEPFEDYLKEFD